MTAKSRSRLRPTKAGPEPVLLGTARADVSRAGFPVMAVSRTPPLARFQESGKPAPPLRISAGGDGWRDTPGSNAKLEIPYKVQTRSWLIGNLHFPLLNPIPTEPPAKPRWLIPVPTPESWRLPSASLRNRPSGPASGKRADSDGSPTLPSINPS